MAWNEPGNGEKDPWGNRGNDGPPDLDEVIRNMQRKFQSLFGGGSSNNDGTSSNGSNGIGAGLLLAVVALVWLASGIYIVDPPERGVVLQFGKYKETTLSGPHWHIPYPIQTVEVVNVDESRTAEIGFRSTAGRSGMVASEALMLTQDENIIEMKIEIQYRVEKPADFLFNVENPVRTLQQMTESAVREVVGRSLMDDVLTTGRQEVAIKSEKLLQSLLSDYGTGLLVTSFNIPDAQAPAQVQAAFDDVVKAGADKVRMKNEAEAYANDVVPRARGAGFRVVQEAEAYKSQILAKAQGETSRFLQVMNEYEKAPDITRERLYLDTMESVYSRTQKVMVDVSKDSSNVLYLPLDKMRGSSKSDPTRIDLSNMTTYPTSNSNGLNTGAAQDSARSRGGR
ncbi:HflK protein [Methylophaga sp. 42_25_T18]|nr:HflK protein [Methylophaga sp. 42_25_T18]OUR86189.1 HflK protein [Methylophaga sp. 42_8_T64]